MEERYNVYFAGQLLDGHDLPAVRQKLAKIFNADGTTLDKLFSGKAQLIKRDCDKTTALKYKDAMERAGAVPILKVTEATATSAKPVPARPMTAAEKIAALAAAPEATLYSSSAPGAAAQAPDRDAAAEPGSIVLTPPGTEVLRENERPQPTRREIDTTGLEVDATALRLSEVSPPPPAAPDTSHLSMGKVGDAIPNLPSTDTPLSPSIDGLALAAAGTDFSDCVAPEPLATPRDLSALSLSPSGSPLLEEQYRSREAGTVPAIDHISLKD